MFTITRFKVWLIDFDLLTASMCVCRVQEVWKSNPVPAKSDSLTHSLPPHTTASTSTTVVDNYLGEYKGLDSTKPLASFTTTRSQ